MWFVLSALCAAPADAASPEDVAKELSTLEATLRRTDTSPEEVKTAAIRQQLLYRQYAHDAAGTKAIVGALDGDMKWIVSQNLTATKKISHTVKNLKSTVPAWTISPALPPQTLVGYYKKAEAEHGVPWEVIAAINLVETRMGRLRGVSWAGASGPMQFMPKTWEAYGKGDVTDTHDAILGAGNYLGKMGAKKDLDKAIWHYNHSDDYVQAVRGFAAVLEKNPEAYRGYWGWQVYYKTTSGTVMLPEGYHQDKPINVKTWCESTPDCSL